MVTSVKMKKLAQPADVSDAIDKTPSAPPATAAAGLDDLIGELDQDDGQQQAADTRQEAKQEKLQLDTIQADILDVLDMAALPAKHLMPWLTPEQFDQLWGREKRKQIAEPLAAIARRNGWDMGGLLNEYGPYAALAMALGPSAYVTFKVRQEAKAYYAQQAAPKAGDGAAAA